MKLNLNSFAAALSKPKASTQKSRTQPIRNDVSFKGNVKLKSAPKTDVFTKSNNSVKNA